MDTCRDSERKKRTRSTKYPRISKPLHLAQASYDCVVIGSGYGGGIAASRMARAGQSVCLLERGKERWPGEYPETLTQTAKELNISGNRSRAFHKDKQIKFGNTSGMYHLIVGDGQSAVVGNGKLNLPPTCHLWHRVDGWMPFFLSLFLSFCFPPF